MTNPIITMQQTQPIRVSYTETITNANEELLGMKFSYTITNKLITILVLYEAPSPYDQRDTSVPAQYLDRYEEAGWWSDGAQNADNAEQRLDAVIDELQELIQDTCHGLLLEVAGTPAPTTVSEKRVESDWEIREEQEVGEPRLPPQTLHQYMYPDTLVVQLVSQGGKLKGIRRDDAPPPTRWPARPEIAALESKTNIRVPVYTPSQLQVLKSFLFHSWVLLVSTPDRQVLCCKLSAGHGNFFEREYKTLRKMLDAGCTTEMLRVPQPRGLIRTDDRHGEQGIVGILIDHIDTERYELTFHLAPAPLTASPGRDAMGINYKKDVKNGTSHNYETSFLKSRHLVARSGYLRFNTQSIHCTTSTSSGATQKRQTSYWTGTTICGLLILVGVPLQVGLTRN